MSSRDLLYYSVLRLPPEDTGPNSVRNPVAGGAFQTLFRIQNADVDFSDYGLRVGRFHRRRYDGATPDREEITPAVILSDDQPTPSLLEIAQRDEARRARDYAVDVSLLREQLGIGTVLRHSDGRLEAAYKGVKMDLFGQSQASLVPMSGSIPLSALSIVKWVEGESLQELYRREGVGMWKTLGALPDDAFTNLMQQLKLMRECGHALDVQQNLQNIMVNLKPDLSKGESYFTIVDVGYFSPRAAELLNTPEMLTRTFFPRGEGYEAARDDAEKLLGKFVQGAKTARMGTSSPEALIVRDLEVFLESGAQIIRTALSHEQAQAAAQEFMQIPAPLVVPHREVLPSVYEHLRHFDLRQPEDKLLRYLQDIAHAQMGRGLDR